jgi:hypothetical protein
VKKKFTWVHYGRDPGAEIKKAYTDANKVTRTVAVEYRHRKKKREELKP